MPRNIGIRLSRGEYLMFVDSDDAITNTALEELYTVAKNFDADALHSEKYFRADDENFTTDKNFLNAVAAIKADFVDKPTPMSEDLAERMKNFSLEKFDWSTCNNFIRREIVARNGIEFPLLESFEDAAFALKVLCSAKNVVRIPNVFYIYRYRQGSTTKKVLPPDKRLIRGVSNIAKLIKIVDEIFSNFDSLRESALKYVLFDMLTRRAAMVTFPVYEQIPVHIFDNVIRKCIDDSGNSTALTAFLFSRMNVFNIQLYRQGAKIQQMDVHIQKQNQIIQQLQAQLQKSKS